MSRGNVLLEAESFEAVGEDAVSEETKEKSDTENGIYIKGKALPFGKPSRNGVQYDKESVKKTHEQLEGLTMLFNHKKDWVSGHILNTEVVEDGLMYEGDINPNAEMPNGVTVAEAIKRGDIQTVSIQAFVEGMGEEADEEAIIQDMETEKVKVRSWLEISPVSIAGFPDTSVMPERLKDQGVQPVTEMVGTKNLEQTDNNKEETEEPENGEDTGKEAPEFDDMGECISYHMNEKDMEQDQAVAVCMDKMEKEDLPDDLQEAISKEQFEFSPVPTHVLYDTEEKAKRRAENLGLEDIHEHQMADQIFYMAGENHEAWVNAIERENPLDRGENNTSGDDNNMSEQEEQDDSQENEDVKSEQVTQEAFIDFVAEHMEGLDAEDVANAVGDSNFTGLDQGEVAKLLAMEFELDTDTVMDAIGQLEDMEGEAYGDKDDDDEDDSDMDESEESEESTEEESSDEEIDESKQELKDKVSELEERLETLVSEDEGESKQESPAGESESTVPRRPSFKDVLDK